ncbi:hypothetical protein GOP47_0018159 [Adiantum capillus-veneris]|uniref:poly(ADP-ribose) glycohydrolase n=1 Tax=Adiantum capillus-veneris TaxID=13818 RepID=A0A9D4ZCI0_ADICA|nr:hypothetical protein GOP47_0018159 [Adiantum capillus-veneris]
MEIQAERYASVPPLSDKRSLLSDKPPPDFESLRRVLLKRVGGGGHRLASLYTSILAFDDYMQRSSHSPRFDFFSDLLPHIHSWAFAYPSPAPLKVPLLRAGSPSHALLSRGTIRTLLSNAFFLNVLPFRKAQACDHHVSASMHGSRAHDVRASADHHAPTPEMAQFGDISFMGLYTSSRELAKERLLCLLAYFALALHFQPQELEEEVCFERHVLSESDTPNWTALNLRINVNHIRVHTQSMENTDGRCIMDFANKALHIHKIIPSATQEEVLFSACPEAFPGILFCDVLKDREVIVIRNVRRFVEYKGYGSTFKFEGLYPGVRFHDIIAADATNTMHFTRPMNERDLNKAYLAFIAAASTSSSSSFSATKISTSHWGCGAFHGDKHHKFLQQVCASALAGVLLDYSTFGDAQTATSFKRLLGLIGSRCHTIGSVYRAMSGYRRERGEFFDYVYGNLSQ